LHKLIRVELQHALMHLSAGALSEAQNHLRIALRLYEAAPFGTIPPQVGNAIMWAANSKVEPDFAIMTLDQALKLLDENAL
jgi:hypothetical protein